MHVRVSKARARTLALLLAAAALGPVAEGAVLWKDASLDSLNSTTSWWTTEAGTTDPASIASTDVFRFGGSGQGATITGVNLGGSMSIAGIRLDNSTGTPNYSVTINATAGQVLTLNAGDATTTGMSNAAYGILLNSGAGGSLTLNTDVALGASQQWVTGNTRGITMNGALSLGSYGLTLNVAGGAQAITGIISGTGSVTKSNVNGATLSGANTFSGGVTLSAGTLNINNASALGTGTFTIAGGTIDNTSGAALTLSTNNALALNATVTFAGSSDLNLGTGAVTLGASRAFAVTGTALTIGGVISGSGFAITKSGTGTLVLANSANLFTGSLSGAGAFVGGVVRVVNLQSAGTADSLGNQVAGSRTIALNGTTLDYNGSGVSSTDRDIDLRASSVIQNNNATGTVNFTSSTFLTTLTASARTLTLGGSNTTANSFAGVIKDSGVGTLTTLTKSGAGTWVITGANTATGGTIVNQGVLRVTGSGVLPGVSGLATDAGNIWFTSVNSGGTIEFETVANLGAASQVRFRNTGGTAGSGGGLRYIGSTTETLTKTLQSDSTIGIRLESSATGSGLLIVNGAFSQADRPLYLGGTGTNNNQLGIAFTGASSLNKSGAGKWVLGVSNSYSGGTNLTGGTLAFVNGGLGTTGNITVNGGSLQWHSTNTQDISSRLVLAASGAATFDTNGNNVTFGTAFGSSASSTFTKAGAGTLTLGTAATVNTYTGATTVTGGTLSVSADENLGAAPGSATPGQLVLNGGALSASSSFTLATTRGTSLGASGGTFDVAATKGLIYGGIIAGSGTLTKTGAGQLSLFGYNTYTGATTVTGGTLAISGTETSLGAAPVSATPGQLTLNGGTLAATASVTLSSNRGIALGASGGTLRVNTASHTMSYGGVIAGAGALTKSGAGTLSLTGANTYTGSTTVSAGTLAIGATGSLVADSAVSVSSGATLSVLAGGAVGGAVSIAANASLSGAGTFSSDLTLSGTGTLSGSVAGATTINSGGNLTATGTLGAVTLNSGGTLSGSGTLGALSVAAGTATLTAGNGTSGVLTASSLTFAGAATLNIGTLSNYTSAAAFNVTGTLTLNGAAGAVSVGLSSGGVANGTYNLISFGSGPADASGFAISGPSLSSRQSASSQVVGGVLQYVVDGDNPYWTGANGNAFSGGSNWRLLSAGTVTDFEANDSLLFNDNATGSTTVDVSGANVAPSLLTFDNTAKSYTLQGDSSVTGANLVKTGSGSLTVANANTFGNVTLSGGSLVLANASALGSAAVTLSTGATLDLNGNATAAAVALSGGTVTGAGTLSGVVSGTGSLAKSGAGTLVLSGANTFTGSTTVTGGTLEVAADSGLGAAPVVATVGQLTLDGGTLSATAGFTLATTRGISLGAAGGTIQVAGGQTISYGGVAAGAGSLTKSGNGTLSLSGANTYTGATTVTGGTLEVGGTLGGGAYAGDIANAGVLSITASANQTLSGVLSGSGVLAKSGDGTLTLSGANTYTGATTVTGGTLAVSSDDSLGAAPGSATTGHLTLSGGTLSATAGFTLSANRGLTLGASGGTVNVASGQTLAYAGVAEGSGALTKTGNGTLTLSGANTYAGATSVTGGTLVISSDANLGAAPGSAAPGQLALNGGTLSATAGFTLSANRGLSLGASGGTVNVASGQTVAYGGIAAGLGALTKAGAGTLVLSGVNTYSGITTLNGGTLEIAADSGLGAAPGAATAGRLVFNSGTLSAAGTFTLSANRGVTLNGTGGNLQVATGQTVTYGGVMAGVGALTKSGNGTLVLSAANTFTGGASLAEGTLRFATSGALSSGSAVSVATGATFEWARDANVNYAFSGGGTILRSTGTGNALFSGNNSGFTGTWNVTSGYIGIVTDANLGSVSAGLTLNGGGIYFTATGNTLAAGRTVTLGAGGGWLNGATSNTNTFASKFTGTGGLTKVSGELAILTNADNDFSGNISINTGTLEIGGAGRLGAGSYAGAIANGTALKFSSSANQTLSGVISGVGTLSKSGAGNLTLSAANTFTGTTTLSEGTLTYGVDNALSTGAVTLSGGTWDMAGYSDTVGAVSISGGSIAGTGTLTGASYAVSATTGTVTISVNLAGASSLSKTGAGNLTLSGTNSSFSGSLSFVGGVVSVSKLANGGSNSSLGSGSGAIVLNGAALTYIGAGGDSTDRAIDMRSGLTLSNNSATGAITFTAGSVVQGGTASARTLTFGGSNTARNVFQSVIGNSGTGANITSVAKSGAGTWVLSGANTYSGATSINAGILEVTVDAALGGTAAGTTVASGGALRLNAVNYSNAEALSISGTGVSGGGALVNSGTSTYAGAITAAANATIQLGGGTLNLTGGLVKDGTVLTIAGAGTLNVGTVGISGASAGSDLVVSGSTVNLNIASTYNGPTYLRDGATLNAAVANALPTASGRGAVVMDDSGAGGSTLALTGASQSIASLSGAASSAVSIGSGYTLTVGSASGSATFAGLISGAGALAKDGASSLNLTGANTYAGGTALSAGTLVIGDVASLGTGTVNVTGGTLNLGGLNIANTLNVTGGTLVGATGYSGTANVGADLTLSTSNAGFSGTLAVSTGTLTVGDDAALGSTSAGRVTIADGATLDLNGRNVAAATLTLDGSGLLGSGALVNSSVGTTATHGGAITLASTVTINGAGNIALTGAISGGANGLIKAGAGTLTLSGANTYTGETSVTAGKLVVNGTVAGDVTIASGAILGGSGTIAGNVSVSGAHNPGNSPGVQTISGSLTYSAGSSVGWELNGNTTTQTSPSATFDQILVGGNLTFDGSTSLVLSFNGAGSTVDWTNPFWSTYRTWTLFDLSTGSITGANNFSLAGASLYTGLLINGSYVDSSGTRTLSSVYEHGGFYLQQVGNDLRVSFTPVPEPGTYGLGLGALALALAAVRRRAKRA